MAGIIFMDGFTTGPTAATVASGTGCLLWDYRLSRAANFSTVKRTGGACHGTGFADNSTWGIGKVLSNYSELWIGFALRLATGGTFPSGRWLVSLNDGSMTAVQAGIRLSSLALQLHNGTSALATGSTTLSLDQWYYLLWYLKADGSAGASSLSLYDLSGDITGTGVTPTEEWNVSGVDTQSTANAYVNRFRIWAYHHSNGNTYIDDLYVADDQFQGPVRIYPAAVTGDGAANQWTRSSGSNNYEMVDDALASAGDGDSTYNSSNTGGQQELYTHAGITPDGPVRCVQAEYIDREDDAAGRSLKPVLRSGGTTYDGANVRLCPAAYGAPHLHQAWPLDPATSVEWAAAAVNAAQPGMESVAA